MPPVSFNEEESLTRQYAASRESAGITAWLIKRGFASDRNSAQRLLVVVLICCVVVGVAAPLLLGGSDSPDVSEEQIRAAIRPLPPPR